MEGKRDQSISNTAVSLLVYLELYLSRDLPTLIKKLLTISLGGRSWEQLGGIR